MGRIFALPILVLLVGIVAAVAVFLSLSLDDSRQEKAQLNVLAESILSTVSERVQDRVRILERLAERMERSAQPDHAAWRADARQIVKDVTEVETVYWSDRDFIVRWPVDQAWRSDLVGLDHKDTTERHAQLMVARSTDRPQASGLTELKDGGKGFIFDIPVSKPDRSSFGYLHAVFNYQQLLKGAYPWAGDNYELRLTVDGTSVVDAQGEHSGVFGDHSGVSSASILGATWHIRLDHLHPGGLLDLYFIPLVTSLLVFLLVIAAGAALQFRSRALERARLNLATHRRLQVAINALESPFAFFDNQDRLQNWNRAFVSANGPISAHIHRGIGYEAILRAVLDAGMIPEAVGQEEFFLKQRMALHALPSFTVERQHVNDVWIRTVEKRTSDGGTAALWIDTTEQRQRQGELEVLNDQLTEKHIALELARQQLKREEERFRTFATASADWFWETDSNHIITWMSANIERIGAHSPDWYIGKPRLELSEPSEGDDAHWQEHLRALENREPYRDIEMCHADSDGQFWIRSSGVPRFDDSGDFVGYMGTGTNISDLKLAEQRYKALQEQLSKAVSGISEGLLIFSPDDRLILCNDNFREHNPWSADDIVEGMNFHQLLRLSAERGLPEHWSPEECENWFQERTSMRDHPGTFMEFETRDGKWCRVADTRTADGGTVTIRSDITDLKTRQMELEVERNNAEAANRAKTDFLTNMSHELRTPLNAIIGFSDVMVTGIFGDLPDRYRTYADDISSSGKHLLSLINDLLDSAKIESGSFELEVTEFSLTDVVQQATALITSLAEERQLFLELSDFNEQAALRADQRALRQILLNLLSNAVKFSPRHGTVNLDVACAGHDLTIRISDTGIGIGKDDLDRVFDRFVQVQDPLHRSHDGTGIGLPLSRSLAEMHGGSLYLESEVGQGTTAVLHLPGVLVEACNPPMRQAV